MKTVKPSTKPARLFRSKSSACPTYRTPVKTQWCWQMRRRPAKSHSSVRPIPRYTLGQTAGGEAGKYVQQHGRKPSPILVGHHQSRRAKVLRSFGGQPEKLSTDEVKGTTARRMVLLIGRLTLGHRFQERSSSAPTCVQTLLRANLRENESETWKSRYYNIIYDAIDDVSGHGAACWRRRERAELPVWSKSVRSSASKVGNIAGCMVYRPIVVYAIPHPPHPQQRGHPHRRTVFFETLQRRRQRSPHGLRMRLDDPRLQQKLREGNQLEMLRHRRSSPFACTVSCK